MESIVGKILCDRYRVIEQLNQNRFSSVFIAEPLDSYDGGQCQIERLQPNYDSEVLGARSWQKILQAFMTQGNIIKNISQHPQIPRLLAFFECDREFYLVREFIAGDNLEQKLAEGLLNEAEAISWLKEILGVLSFVHQADIIHLNIQPSSLIQHQNGQKFLSNFSSVKNTIFFDKNLFKVVGDDDFHPPEQKEGNPDFSTDIYALGKTIIYALTGKVSECIRSSADTSGEDNNGVVADIKPELADILNKMVSSPSQRYQSASEVLEELDFDREVVTLPPPVFTNFNPPVASPKSRKKNKLPDGYAAKSKQKIIWLLLALPFAVALVIVGIGINRNSYNNFKIYSNDNYEFEIKYPQDWSSRNLEDPITGEVVVFSSDTETATDSYQESLYITVEYLPSATTTLEEYTQTVFERIKQARGRDVEVYQDRKTKIGKYPARRVIYSREENGLQLRQMETFTIKEDKVYVAIYTAERAKFSKFLKTAKKMIASWKIE